MNKAAKVIFYIGVAVIGWRAMRYFYGRRLHANDFRTEQSATRRKKDYRRSTERWENEGGATLAYKSDPFYY